MAMATLGLSQRAALRSSTTRDSINGVKVPGNSKQAQRGARARARAQPAAKAEAGSEGQREDAVLGIERMRLHNLSPQPGARKPRKRKGRGHSAGKGGSAGKGMRGQKQRAGQALPGGFEGNQNPIHNRVPKLKGIGGGMRKGRRNFVEANLGAIQQAIDNGRIDPSQEVTKSTIELAGLCKFTGRERRLPLKVLGGGSLTSPITIAASDFTESAREKINQAGGSIRVVPLRRKWTRHGKEVVGFEALLQEEQEEASSSSD